MGGLPRGVCTHSLSPSALISATRSSLTCRSPEGSSGKLSRAFSMTILYRIASRIRIHKRLCCLIFVSGDSAFRGRHVRFGMRQSMPFSNIASCAEVGLILPSFAAGQINRPRSKRLLNRHAPCESRHMILSKPPRRPRNTNRWPENGSCSNVFSACAASVLDLSRFDAAPLIAFTAAKETNYGAETDG